MHRQRFATLAFALILTAFVGCGESQPNPPAVQENTPEAVKKSSEMMRDATKGSVPKSLKGAGATK